jgi:hypothetical protein
MSFEPSPLLKPRSDALDEVGKTCLRLTQILSCRRDDLHTSAGRPI